jgi:hypothetical protein
VAVSLLLRVPPKGKHTAEFGDYENSYLSPFFSDLKIHHCHESPAIGKGGTHPQTLLNQENFLKDEFQC